MKFESLTLGMILTMFLVMFGPMKLIAPYARLTSGMGTAESRRLALKGTGFAIAGGMITAVLGRRILEKWGISMGALYLSAGIVLLIVALRTVLEVYETRPSERGSAPTPHNPALFPLAFPLILTPYGIAALILVLAATTGTTRTLEVLGLFLGVMLLNLLVMEFSDTIIERGSVILALFSTVLGVLQVALAVQLILNALAMLHILPGT